MLFEQLGEEYPDTLGSIIAAEGAIANVVGMTQMNPPVKDLCESIRGPPGGSLRLIPFFPVPRMTPILRNRHEKVQEATINLIGRIGSSFLTLRLQWGLKFPIQPIAVPSSCPLGSGCESVLSC